MKTRLNNSILSIKSFYKKLKLIYSNNIELMMIKDISEGIIS